MTAVLSHLLWTAASPDCRSRPLRPCPGSHCPLPPLQAAILAIGTSQQRAFIGPGSKPATETNMTVTLSADHRVYDGALAARVLQAFKTQVENPSRLLM